MNKNSQRSIRSVAIVLLVITMPVISATGVATASIAVPDADRESTFAQSTAETCTPAEAESTQLDQYVIQATDDTVTKTTPAKVSGQVTAPHSNPCRVTVQMVMTIPSGMFVSGNQNVDSGGQGQLTSTFEVLPGESVSMSGNLYGSDLGSKLVLVDFNYYPVGYPNEIRSVSGFSLDINVAESNPGPGSEGSDSTEDTVVLYVLAGVVVGGLGVMLVRD